MKIAFIDHSFHLITKSSFFFLDLLKQNFIVDTYFDDSWKSGKSFNCDEIINNDYSCVIFWQILGENVIKVINKFQKNVFLVPMYDAVVYSNYDFWYPYKDAFIINFSKYLHKKIINYGFKSTYFQYFPDSKTYSNSPDFNSLNGFFWQRTDQITWDTIKKLIINQKNIKIHIHGAPDPGYEFVKPNLEDINMYNLTISQWFEDKNEYVNIVNNSNLYFCPRSFEGIGMSFIEAMSMGKCVIAPNYPTMNEYIKNGKTGILYDLEKPIPIDFSVSKKIGANARKYILKGHLKWESEKIKIIRLLKEPNSFSNKNFSDKIKSKLYRLKLFFIYVLLKDFNKLKNKI